MWKVVSVGFEKCPESMPVEWGRKYFKLLCKENQNLNAYTERFVSVEFEFSARFSTLANSGI